MSIRNRVTDLTPFTRSDPIVVTGSLVSTDFAGDEGLGGRAMMITGVGVCGREVDVFRGS
jgi:hypothetical protein